MSEYLDKPLRSEMEARLEAQEKWLRMEIKTDAMLELTRVMDRNLLSKSMQNEILKALSRVIMPHQDN